MGETKIEGPREFPVIFTADSVRAILAGRKTQTRRPVKDSNSCGNWRASELDLTRAYVSLVGNPGPYLHAPVLQSALVAKGWPADDEVVDRLYPRWQVGDRLWIREAYTIESNRGLDCPDVYPPPFPGDGHPIEWHEDEDEGRWWRQAHYRATDPPPDLCCQDDDCRACGEPGSGYGPHWQSPIRMPRWFSRLTLEVTEVRGQQLQEISEEDARAEGAERVVDAKVGELWRFRYPDDANSSIGKRARNCFIDAWNALNGARYPWSDNPWVWALSFKRVEGR